MDISEHELITRFNNLEGNLSMLKIKELEKDIHIYLKSIKKSIPSLMEVLIMLKLYREVNEFSKFQYQIKVDKTYSIADPIVARLKYVEKEDFSPTDLVITQVILGFVRDIDEAKKLCEKGLWALKKYMSESPDYKRAKFFYHFNILSRFLKADFFEIDRIKEIDRHNMVREAFEYHLDRALRICINKKNRVPGSYEYYLNVRAAIMDKDSESAMENLFAMKEFRKEKKIYDLARTELAEYSFHEDFDLTEKHHNIAIGARIRKLREDVGVTLAELSEKLGYGSEGNMSSMERGDLGLTSFRLAKVSKVFGVTLEELCFGLTEKPRKPLTKEEFKYSKS